MPVGTASTLRLFDRSGVVLAALIVVGFAVLFAAAQYMRPASGEGFYAYMSHGLMVTIFAPAFLLPLAAVGVSLTRYWQAVGGGRVTWAAVKDACLAAGQMRNLSGGHGDGCNFEEGDRFSNRRRWLHQFPNALQNQE